MSPFAAFHDQLIVAPLKLRSERGRTDCPMRSPSTIN